MFQQKKLQKHFASNIHKFSSTKHAHSLPSHNSCIFNGIEENQFPFTLVLVLAMFYENKKRFINLFELSHRLFISICCYLKASNRIINISNHPKVYNVHLLYYCMKKNLSENILAILKGFKLKKIKLLITSILLSKFA